MKHYGNHRVSFQTMNKLCESHRWQNNPGSPHSEVAPTQWWTSRFMGAALAWGGDPQTETGHRVHLHLPYLERPSSKCGSQALGNVVTSLSITNRPSKPECCFAPGFGSTGLGWAWGSSNTFPRCGWGSRNRHRLGKHGCVCSTGAFHVGEGGQSSSQQPYMLMRVF